MLWYANSLTDRALRKLARRSAWGADLLDQSLTTAWYRADWSNVADDELVFLIPSLSHWRSAQVPADASLKHGPSDFLARSLTEQANAVATLMEKHGGKQPVSQAEARDKIASFGLVSSLRAIATETAAAMGHADDATEQSPQPKAIPDWLAAALVALAYCDRALADVLRGAGRQRGGESPLIDWPMNLADALMVSASTRLNAAYIYPEYSYAHELLSLAAILGHLSCGRTVYFSQQFAETFLDSLPKRRSADSQVACVVHGLAEQAAGATRLVTLARIVAATGSARRVTPRARRMLHPVRSIGSERLIERLGERGPRPVKRDA